MYWLMSANPSIYNHDKAFEDKGFIDWTQNRITSFNVNDYVYLY